MNGQTWAAAVVIGLTLIGVAIGRYPLLQMNRATIALVGATILIALGVLTLDQAYRAVDWNTVLLLFGMMVLNVNLRMAGFFHLVTAKVLSFARTPRRLLALIIAVSGVFSAVFLNDTIVLVFAPLILDIAAALRRNAIPYLVALVTAANVGSVATITGNPQNMLVGISSGIGYVAFVRALAPIALLGLGVIWVVIVLVYRTDFRPQPFETAYHFLPEVKWPRLWKSLFATTVMLVVLVAGAPTRPTCFRKSTGRCWCSSVRCSWSPGRSRRPDWASICSAHWSRWRIGGPPPSPPWQWC